MQENLLVINNNLVFNKLEKNDDLSVIEHLANAAVSEGFAQTSLVTAVIKSEKNAPTALNTKVHIAVPHVHIGCTTSFLSVATLAKPVEFGDMADLTKHLAVEIVFLIGIKNIASQSLILKKFCDSFQYTDQLQSYLNATSSEELTQLLKKYLAELLVCED